jgi:uncharacterized protein with HEPN domain
MTSSKSSENASDARGSASACSCSIQDIEVLFARSSADDFAKDRYRRVAVERFFEIISEASRHIPDDLKARHAEINWRRMADLGNRLRHAYHLVDAELLWLIAQRDLPPLKAFIESIVGEAKQ